MTTEQYDETIRRLEKSGDWLPDGLEYHVAFKANGNFRVSEIWDSQKQLDAFGGDVTRALAAYNGGPHNVAHWWQFPERTLDAELWIDRIPYKETRNYVKKVIAQYAAYRRLHADAPQRVLDRVEAEVRDEPEAVRKQGIRHRVAVLRALDRHAHRVESNVIPRTDRASR